MAAGLSSFESLASATPEFLEQVAGRHQPFGMNVWAIIALPRFPAHICQPGQTGSEQAAQIQCACDAGCILLVVALSDASHIEMQAVPAASGTALLQVTVDASTRGGGVPERLYGSSILIVGDSNGNLAHASRIRLHFAHISFMNNPSIVVVQALSSSRGRNIFHSGAHHIWRQA